MTPAPAPARVAHPLRVLVLGAGGRLGHAIVHECVAQGATVTATGRRRALPANLRTTHAGSPAAALTYHAGDLDAPGQLEQWIPGHALVVDAAAPYSLLWAPAARASHAAELALRRMARIIALVRANGARYVLLGSFASPPRARSLLPRAAHAMLTASHPYFELKARIESMVQEAMANDLDALVLRPTYCLGPGDTTDPRRALVPMLLQGMLPAVNAHAMNVVDPRDVARMLLRAATGSRVPDRCIDIVGHNTTLEQLAVLAHRLGAAAPPCMHVPALFGAAAAYAAERAGELAGQSARLPSIGTLLLLEQRWVLPGAAQRRLATPLRPLSRTLADTIAWHRTQHAP